VRGFGRNTQAKKDLCQLGRHVGVKKPHVPYRGLRRQFS
jgi:hypothetical protein